MHPPSDLFFIRLVLPFVSKEEIEKYTIPSEEDIYMHFLYYFDTKEIPIKTKNDLYKLQLDFRVMETLAKIEQYEINYKQHGFDYLCNISHDRWCNEWCKKPY